MTRILCCGDRNWTDWETIRKVLRTFPAGTTIIQGENGVIDRDTGKPKRGADLICKYVALEMKFDVMSFPAQWTKYRKGAGPIRNMQMIDDGEPSLVVAFHPDLSKSKGTADMVSQARKTGLDVKIITGKVCETCGGWGQVSFPNNAYSEPCPTCNECGIN